MMLRRQMSTKKWMRTLSPLLAHSSKVCKTKAASAAASHNPRLHPALHLKIGVAQR